MQSEPTIIAAQDWVPPGLVDDVIDAIALTVQKAIGQTDGGVAGVYWSDPELREEVRAVVVGYLKTEHLYREGGTNG